MKDPALPIPNPDDFSEKEKALFASLERDIEMFEQENENYAGILEGKSRDEIAAILGEIRVIDILDQKLSFLTNENQRKITMQEVNRRLVSMGLSEKYPIFEGE